VSECYPYSTLVGARQFAFWGSIECGGQAEAAARLRPLLLLEPRESDTAPPASQRCANNAKLISLVAVLEVSPVVCGHDRRGSTIDAVDRCMSWIKDICPGLIDLPADVQARY